MSSPHKNTRKNDIYSQRRLQLEKLALENRIKALETPYPMTKNKRSIGSISNKSKPDSIKYMANTLRDNPQYVPIKQYLETIEHLNNLKTETINESEINAIDEAIRSIKNHHKLNFQAGGKRTRSNPIKRITRRRRRS
jgi:hypothetical protein